MLIESIIFTLLSVIINQHAHNQSVAVVANRFYSYWLKVKVIEVNYAYKNVMQA